MLTFLAVGGTGYVVDVTVFNVLRSIQPFATLDPSVARTLAVVAAMCVTYLGNRTLTWRDHASGDRRREVALFVLFNIIGFGFSVVTLFVSHDVLGLTSGLADNISANVIGLALGTLFRYVTYKRFVFAGPRPSPVGGVLTPRRRPPTTTPRRCRLASALSAHTAAPAYSEAMHVVVVDDEKRMVELVASYLGDHQVTTTAAHDGPPAWPPPVNPTSTPSCWT